MKGGYTLFLFPKVISENKNVGVKSVMCRQGRKEYIFKNSAFFHLTNNSETFFIHRRPPASPLLGFPLFLSQIRYLHFIVFHRS